jgi:Concanavalin A-like lectin/glucanases superfamily
MVAICRDVYVDPATDVAERERLRRDYVDAARVVSDALGPWQTDLPTAIFCKTDPCRRFFAGPSQRSRTLAPGSSAPGAAYVAGDRTTIVVLRVDAGARAVIAHEMVHVAASLRLRDAPVPQWFHEGLAIDVSGAPDCSDRPAAGVDDLRSLDSPGVWTAHTDVLDQQHPTYCQAGAEVQAWIRRHGERHLEELLTAVRDGASFYERYGPLQNCEPASRCTGPLGAAPPGQLRRFSLDENAGTAAFDRVDRRHEALLDGRARWVAGRAGGAVSVSDGAFVRTDAIAAMGVVDQPLTLALWLRPRMGAGVLVHASVKPSGGDGWCVPFLGFDGTGRMVAQILYGLGPTSFLTATGPGPKADQWSHVAMTWSPESGVRLYVNGALAGVGAPADATKRHYAAASGRPVYLTYGSDRASACWSGAIGKGSFDGAIDELSIHNYEMSPAQILAEASAPAR